MWVSILWGLGVLGKLRAGDLYFYFLSCLRVCHSRDDFLVTSHVALRESWDGKEKREREKRGKKKWNEEIEKEKPNMLNLPPVIVCTEISGRRVYWWFVGRTTWHSRQKTIGKTSFQIMKFRLVHSHLFAAGTHTTHRWKREYQKFNNIKSSSCTFSKSHGSAKRLNFSFILTVWSYCPLIMLGVLWLFPYNLLSPFIFLDSTLESNIIINLENPNLDYLSILQETILNQGRLFFWKRNPTFMCFSSKWNYSFMTYRMGDGTPGCRLHGGYPSHDGSTESWIPDDTLPLPSPLVPNSACSNRHCVPDIHRAAAGVRFIARHTRLQEDSTEVSVAHSCAV